MKEKNDIATEIDGKRICDHCEEPVDSVTPIVVDFGEIELCRRCLTEDANKKEVNQTALRQ